ncbi:MAG: type IV pilus modification PilV family protein, partial [Actinomycetota bacterium]
MFKFHQVLWAKLHNVKKKLKDGEKGLTLVEVVIALLIISIITAIVIHSSIMAIDTSEYNKTKTIALSIANEEMEKIRAMDYGDIGIVGESPEGTLESEAVSPEGYTINYDVSWIEGEDSYKQVAVSVFKQPMKVDVEVITQIYPSESSGAG